jgi:hypothetical protein
VVLAEVGDARPGSLDDPQTEETEHRYLASALRGNAARPFYPRTPPIGSAPWEERR